MPEAAVRSAKLKAPFPYFGGKSRVARVVWQRFGDAPNYIEPFCGSAAMLLGRPTPPRIETINDADCYVANFWRATRFDREAVARLADWPVNECDLHARHRWLVLSEEARQFRQRMRSDPDYFDAKIAAWWCWGLCCWIGGGWCNVCDEEEGWREGRTADGDVEERKPTTTFNMGVHASCLSQKRPRAHSENGDGNGTLPGVLRNPKPRMPTSKRRAIHAGELSQQVPNVGPCKGGGRGINGVPKPSAEWDQRPRLEAMGISASIPIGLGATDGACAIRTAWLMNWFAALEDRLRDVRVCCGDWRRVCTSPSTTTRLGRTCVFLDPPYGKQAGRDMNLYSVESGTVASDVRDYCIERGADPQMRIALCGYAGEGHEVLESMGWDVHCWSAQGGYGCRSKKGRANRDRERIWFSPHCLPAKRESSLFEEAAHA